MEEEHWVLLTRNCFIPMWRNSNGCIVLKSEPGDNSLQWSVSTAPSLAQQAKTSIRSRDTISNFLQWNSKTWSTTRYHANNHLGTSISQIDYSLFYALVLFHFPHYQLVSGHCIDKVIKTLEEWEMIYRVIKAILKIMIILIRTLDKWCHTLRDCIKHHKFKRTNR